MKYKGEEVSMSIKKEKKKIRDIKQSQLVSSRQTTNSPTVVDQKTQIVVGQETKNITMAKIKKELEFKIKNYLVWSFETFTFLYNCFVFLVCYSVNISVHLILSWSR